MTQKKRVRFLPAFILVNSREREEEVLDDQLLLSMFSYAFNICQHMASKAVALIVRLRKIH